LSAEYKVPPTKKVLDKDGNTIEVKLNNRYRIKTFGKIGRGMGIKFEDQYRASSDQRFSYLFKKTGLSVKVDE
jgi:hypothetical protein